MSIKGTFSDEEWKPIPNFEGSYEASSLGQIRSVDRVVRKQSVPMLSRGRILKPRPKGAGYLCVSLGANAKFKTYQIHNLVAVTFIGPRPHRHDVCHCDGTKINNRYDNLRYDTRRGNFFDKKAHGTSNAGERNYNAILTAVDVLKIREMADVITQRELGQMFGVSQGAVCAIISRKTWGHIP